MVAHTLERARAARTDLRGWWARERVTGVALFLFAVRWAAWCVAAAIVVLDVVPKANVEREPILIVGTLAQNTAATLYIPLLRPRVRELIGRSVGRVDDILVLSLLDVTLALAMLFLSGGWDSPYYLYAVASLLVPSSILGLRSNLVLTGAFVAAYVLSVSLSGRGIDGPWHGRELNNFVVFVTLPFIVTIVVQFFGWMSRELAAQREAARQALDDNLRLQREREQLAAEQERMRLAREIHDGIGQSIPGQGGVLAPGLRRAARHARDPRQRRGAATGKRGRSWAPQHPPASGGPGRHVHHRECSRRGHDRPRRTPD